MPKEYSQEDIDLIAQETLGGRLGALVVELSEGDEKGSAVYDNLDLTTDGVWKSSAAELAAILLRWSASKD